MAGVKGEWQRLTPALNLNHDFPTAAQNYGVQDVLADPARLGTFYAFVCYQGVWKTQDWGATWARVSTDGKIEQGRPWGEAIAPDGSYMLAVTGYGPNEGAWRSTDGGKTWSSHRMGGSDDAYSFDIDPKDKNHVLGSTHSTDHIYESRDGGLTWKDAGASGAGLSNYIFFLGSTTWLAVGQADSNVGTRRTTDGGKTWSRVGPMEHAHGASQIYVDPDSGHVYVGARDGVYRSTDGAMSFTKVSQTRANVVFGTASRLYAMDSGANAGGVSPELQSATRSQGTAWAPMTAPSGMTNGAKRVAVVRDSAGAWVIVSGNWLAGIWRFIEK